jgi:hypothetical protein
MSSTQRMMHLCPPGTRGSSFQSTLRSDTSSSRNLSRYRVCATKGIRPTATDQFEPGQGDSINTNGHSGGGCVYVISSFRTSRAFLIRTKLTHYPVEVNEVVENKTLMIRGFEHQTFKCPKCHEIDRRFAFNKRDPQLLLLKASLSRTAITHRTLGPQIAPTTVPAPAARHWRCLIRPFRQRNADVMTCERPLRS